MPAEILEFKKKDGSKPHHRKADKITADEAFTVVKNDILHEWNYYSIKNQLSDYIGSKIPSYAKSNDSADYCNDLNIISQVEEKLNMQVIVSTQSSAKGEKTWSSSFYLDSKLFELSENMKSECHARAVNVLVCIALIRKLNDENDELMEKKR